MSKHRATVHWKRTSDDFSYEGYSREHGWTFAGGTTLRASSAPEYQGDASLVNPEEALAASLASCHLLTFLAIASRKRFVVDSYEDEAVAVMEKNAEGKMAVTRVTLRPRVRFGGERQPSFEEIARMHESAHANCFIANSVRTEVTIEPADA